MLWIVFESGRQVEWHFGEPKPQITETVRVVQADCDELDYIRAEFKNIPDVPKNRVMNWVGDTAKFIAHNL